MPFVRRLRCLFALLALGGGVAGCSPAFNWRDVPVDAQVKALLPCKPDRAERALPLAPEGEQARIGMAGCAVNGITFAVAHWPGVAAQEAPQRMHLWQAATRAQWAEALVEETPASMVQMAVAPPSQHWLLSRVGEKAVQAQIRWFARADGQGGTTLYQATVLGEPAGSPVARTFFEGLQPR